MAGCILKELRIRDAGSGCGYSSNSCCTAVCRILLYSQRFQLGLLRLRSVVPVWYPHGFPSSKQHHHQEDHEKEEAANGSSNAKPDADTKGIVEELASRVAGAEA